jgi:hypothetical protein
MIGYVYGVVAPGGCIRIGSTQNVPSRLRVIASHVPWMPALAFLRAFESVTEARDVEHWIQDWLSAYALRGSWFLINEDRLLELVRILPGVPITQAEFADLVTVQAANPGTFVETIAIDLDVIARLASEGNIE